MQNFVACKICGSNRLWIIKHYHITDTKVWPWDEVYDQIKDLPFPLSIRLGLCRKCGFLFYLDTFSYTDLKQIYEKESRYMRPKEHQLKPGRLWELKHLLDFLQNHLPFSKIKTALDLGAGDFVALDQIIQLDHTIVFEAVDPSYPQSSHKGILVHRTMIEEFIPSKSYDFVTAIHILEHVSSLREFLIKTNAFLKNNGYLYVEVPFQVSPGLFLNRSASVHHINYFTPKTLHYLLAGNGFKVEKLEFDTDSYRRNGMAGMIRVLATKKKSKLPKPNVAETIGYLLNPLPIVRSKFTNQSTKVVKEIE